VQLLSDSNHFYSQYIGICVILVQVRGKSQRTKGGSDCLYLLSPGGFRIEQSVTKCGGERGSCN